MTRPVAAEFLLLALDDESGRFRIDGTKLKAAVAGAALLDLTLDGALRMAVEGDPVKPGRLVRTTQAVQSPVLAEIADLGHGRKPKDVVSRVGGASAWKDRSGALKDGLLAGLAQEGVLRHDAGKVLGLFPTNAWPLDRPEVEREITQRVRGVVVDGQEPDERTAALVGLCQAVDLLPKLLPDVPKSQVRRRGKEVAEGEWGAAAVSKALQEVQAVIMASVTAATVASTTAAGS